MIKCEKESYSGSKLIAFYELDVELSWRGEIKHDDTTTKVRGKVKMPYISDENDYDEFDLSATIDDSYKSKEAADIRSIMAKEGLPKIRNIVAEKFVKELRAGAHVMDKYKGWEDDYKNYKPGEDHGSPAPQPKTETVNLPPPKVSGTRTHTLSLRDRFNLPAAVLFDFFTDSNRISSYTRSPAKFDKTKGGKFENFGGAIHGEILELKQNEKLVLHWRMRDWLDELYSTVTLTFEQQGGGETLLTLEQINIPSVDKHNSEVLPNVEQGWQDRFFKPIKLVTGQLMGSAPTFSNK